MKIIIVLIFIAVVVLIFIKNIISHTSHSKRKIDTNKVKTDKKQDVRKFKNDILVFEGSPNKAICDVMVRTSKEIQKFNELKSNAKTMDALARDSELPLLVAIMGECKTGKSTFINTILGEDCLKCDVTAATAVVTMLKYGEEKALVVHFKDGSSEGYPLEKLEELSAEGDPEGKKIRSKISYLEMYLPNPVLREITIVDTPGLNADESHHTIATKEFMNRADKVLWLLSYAKAGSSTEMAEIGGLDDNLKPICIVNRIDEIDPEEDDIDEMLDDIEKRMGNVISHLVGISALEAREGRKNNDAERFKESRWEQFQKVFNDEILCQCENIKMKSVLIKLKDCIQKLNLTIIAKEKEYKEASRLVNDASKTLAAVKQKKMYYNKLLNDWSPKLGEECIYLTVTLSELPEEIKNYEQLNSQKKKIEGIGIVLRKDIDRLVDDGKLYRRQMDYHNNEIEKLKGDIERYNKSGIFGGKPIFDFDGNNKKNENRRADVNSKAEELDLQNEQFRSRKTELIARFSRDEHETQVFWANVRNQITSTISDNIESMINNIDWNRIDSKSGLDGLKWVLEARNIMDNNVAIDLYKALEYIQESLGLEQTNKTVGIDGAMKKIEEIIIKISGNIIKNNVDNIIQEDNDLEFSKGKLA